METPQKTAEPDTEPLRKWLVEGSSVNMLTPSGTLNKFDVQIRNQYPYSTENEAEALAVQIADLLNKNLVGIDLVKLEWIRYSEILRSSIDDLVYMLQPLQRGAVRLGVAGSDPDTECEVMCVDSMEEAEIIASQHATAKAIGYPTKFADLPGSL